MRGLVCNTYRVGHTAKGLENALPTPAPSLRGKAVTVFIPEEVHEELREYAEEHERSLAAEVRWLIRRYCELSGEI